MVMFVIVPSFSISLDDVDYYLVVFVNVIVVVAVAAAVVG